jgi:hypothetical protein
MKKGTEEIWVYGSLPGCPHKRSSTHSVPTSRTGHYFRKHFISNNKHSQSRQVKPNPSRNNFAAGKQPANIKITKRTQLQKFDLPANKGDHAPTVLNLRQKRTHLVAPTRRARASVAAQASAKADTRFDAWQLIAYQHPKNKCQPMPTYAGGCPCRHVGLWRACPNGVLPKSKGARVCDPQRRATAKMHDNSPRFRAESACRGSHSRAPAFGRRALRKRLFRTRGAKSSGEIRSKPYRSIEV